VRTRIAAAILLGIATVAPSASGSRIAPAERAAAVPPELRLTPIAGPLSGVTAIANAGDARIFITLQRGRILVWNGVEVLPTPFLDLSTLVVCCGEQGLLSTAFHPNYGSNGFFFVNYTDLSGDTVIARYSVSAGDPNVADPFSGRTLLTIDQPFGNHNGGQLQFGPDGQLYIGMGDGGSANDPDCHAQSLDPLPGRQDLLGKMLRIDVDQNVGTPPYYGIPAGNPFVAAGGPDEAWSIGLRNPWRFSFDRLTGDLFIGDVGQGLREEIDFQSAGSGAGANYGWKIMEGTLCTENTGNCPASTPACFSPAFTDPILEYAHSVGRCSVTGGYVYRGLSIPDLYGTYLFGDYCSGEIFGARPAGGGAFTSELMTIAADLLTTFGEDASGELYVGTGGGFVYRIEGPAPISPVIGTIAPATGYERGGEAVRITGANFTGATTVRFGANPAAAVSVLSPTELTAITPPGELGLVVVTVANPGATPAVRPDGFAYVAIPRVVPPDHGTRVVTRPTP
jgi:glucose/arabinose dehydrogenase